VWFLAEGGKVRVSLNTNRQKTRNLENNPACNLFILDVTNPFRYLEVRGDALVEPDEDFSFAAKVSAKYSSDVRAYDQPGESRVVVTVEPAKVNAVNMSG
jgi:PPOX class probable F420-dependent enzyme